MCFIRKQIKNKKLSFLVLSKTKAASAMQIRMFGPVVNCLPAVISKTFSNTKPFSFFYKE